MTDHSTPVVLVILDGWGLAEPGPGNAISLAETPVIDKHWKCYPHTTLSTSGRDVGLRPGQMGNSEVGHLNIGAGFVVYQSITLIDVAIENGTFYENEALLHAAQAARNAGTTLHLMGLVSDGGVHSHISHLEALLELARRQDVENVAIHAFLDGRDTSPTGGADYLKQVQVMCATAGVGRIATIVGRYFAMDRDKRWDRTRRAFDLLVHGMGDRVNDPIEGVRARYERDVTDEFMEPLWVGNDDDEPITIQDGDSVIFFNFRSDRPRQLCQALVGPAPDDDSFADRPAKLTFVTMLPYADFLDVETAFAPVHVENPLARAISEAGRRQFHTAETEKYAHVTYFLNGGREEPFTGEERKMIPSPKVATYDLQPEMSADGVASAAVEAISSRAYDFVVLNFANCDMVGHTGIIRAAVAATEAVDSQLGRVLAAATGHGYAALVIADHGNAEEMLVPGTQEPMTAHTTNPVPCMLVAPDDSPLRHVSLRDGGRLADVAPTVLRLMGIEPPEAMTGSPLT